MPQLRIGNIQFHIEIPMLLLFYAFMVSDTVSTNLILYRTCYITLNYNKSDCSALINNNTSNSTKHIEDNVQVYASYVITTISWIENIIPTILCLLFGPWSDKYGRKPMMIMPIGAFALAYGIKTILSVIPTLSPWWFLVPSVVAVSTGGFATYFTAVLCYITDVSTPENRGVRMGLYEGVLAIGIFSGTLSSSYLFKAIDFWGVFATSTVCVFISFLYSIFFIPESVESSETFKTKIKDLFNISHVKSMIHTTFKQREYYQRAILMMTIFILVLNILNINGDSNVIYLYIREKFHWDLKHYTFYNAGKSVTWVIGTIFGVYILHKLCKIKEIQLLIMGFTALVISLLIQALATKDWHLYLGASIRSLASVVSPMLRTIISKLVPSNEIGKILPVSVTMESFITLVGSPLYTAIYDSTIDTYPGAFNFVTVGINAVNLILTVVVVILKRQQHNYMNMLPESTASIN